ncbi:MAG: hypothetical protein VW874_07165 [Gammaproteobacteria bacterium]
MMPVLACLIPFFMSRLFSLLLTAFVISCIASQTLRAKELEPLSEGTLPVASTNFMLAEKYHSMAGEELEKYLIGESTWYGKDRYITDLMMYPDATWTVPVNVPDNSELYGSLSGETLPTMAFVTYPTVAMASPRKYDFPYHGSAYGSFEHMLMPGEKPKFANTEKKYPLIVLAHGSSAHGVYDIAHANQLARHGYIVAVVMYGDNRSASLMGGNYSLQFLRSLITKAVVDSLVSSEQFGPYIDADNIGISGHSFGGFTALTSAGAKANGHPESVVDPRTKAIVLAAPWVGRNDQEQRYYVFGEQNETLKNVSAPTISFVASKDTVTTPESIYPAMQLLSGPTYVIELVDQPHVFEDGSWLDRNNWEVIFFNAYLKNDATALAMLKEGRSMAGGNVDRQLMDYQSLPE